jgi:hypothetical protein
MVITVPMAPLFQPCAKKKNTQERADTRLHIGHKKIQRPQRPGDCGGYFIFSLLALHIAMYNTR